MKLPKIRLGWVGLLMRRVPLALLILVLAVAPVWLLDFGPSNASLGPGESGMEAATIPPEPPEPEDTEPLAVQKKLNIGRGDTLMGLMLSAGIPRQVAHAAITALRDQFDPKRLRPSDEIVAGFERDPVDPEREIFTGLTIRPDHVREYMVRRDDEGGFQASLATKTLTRQTVRVAGVIRTSLYEAAVEAGVPPTVLMELVRIYSWDVDFQRSIRPDDRFDLMYELYRTKDGTLVRTGDIVFANLMLQGENNPLYRHTTADELTGYFDENGKSARKALMRTPINGARLSSGYGVRRHPILGYNKMHRGVDFAAPAGTPVYAAGDGTVVYRGRNGAYGNYVRIRHNSEYATAYAHLKSFARKAQRGSRVTQGQIIGYVGTTGRSTGAHLHYEILRRGKQTNPMRVKMPSGRSLAGKELERFKEVRAGIDERFAALPVTAKVADSAVARPEAR